MTPAKTATVFVALVAAGIVLPIGVGVALAAITAKFGGAWAMGFLLVVLLAGGWFGVYFAEKGYI